MLELTERSEEYSQEYLAFKQELDTELNKAADGFVKIGYMLRRAEDTDILRTSGYRNVTEFAAAEYGLSKDYVGRIREDLSAPDGVNSLTFWCYINQKLRSVLK